MVKLVKIVRQTACTEISDELAELLEEHSAGCRGRTFIVVDQRPERERLEYVCEGCGQRFTEDPT